MPCTILPLLLSSLFPKPGHEQESNRVGRPGRVMAGFRQDGTELTAAQVVRYSALFGCSTTSSSLGTNQRR